MHAWIAAHPRTYLLTYRARGRLIRYVLVDEKTGRHVSHWPPGDDA
jgi:hypothetical protein